MSFHENQKKITSELNHVLGEVSEDEVDAAIELLSSANRIFLDALGRAKFAGQSFVMRLMHMGFEVYVIGETNTPNFDKGDLLVVCSGSGETTRFVNNAALAHNLGGRVLVFSATPDSTLASMADAAVIFKAPSKRQSESSFVSSQPMASLFEQSILVGGDAIVLSLMERSDKSNEEMFSRHTNIE